MKMSRFWSWGLAVSLLFLGCVTSKVQKHPRDPDKVEKRPRGAEASVAPPPDPKNLRATLLQRELEPLPPVEFSLATGDAAGSVEARGVPSMRRQAGRNETMTVPLGTEQAMGCTFFKDRIDPATIIWRVVASLKEAEAKSKLKIAQIVPKQILAIGGAPLFLVDVSYTTDSERGTLAGLLKMAVFAHDRHAFLCQHDELGYARSFERIVSDLARSLHAPEVKQLEPRFSELLVLKSDSQPVGWLQRSILSRDGGGSVSMTFMTLALLPSPTELTAIDSTQVDLTNAQDRLLKTTFARAINGTVDQRVELKADPKKRAYRYSATLSGKRIGGTFSTQHDLHSDLWVAKRLREGARTVRHESYRPSENATTALETVYRRASKDSREVQIITGGARISGHLDEYGLLSRFDMPMGDIKLLCERIWSTGTP